MDKTAHKPQPRTIAPCAGLLFALALRSLSLLAQPVAISPFAGPPDDIGPDHRSWTAQAAAHPGRTVGAPSVEIATGMNFWNGQAWTPSVPSFIVADGAFVANRVQHKIRLSPDIYGESAVSATSPDGILVRSTPVAIALYDPVDGSSSVIGTITNSLGVLLDTNVVFYESAFDGVCANVVYSLDRSSFAQDIEFTGRLDPMAFGFSTNHPIRIQIWTEFYQVPVPDIIKQPIYIEQDAAVRNQMVSPDLIDESIGFGEYVLGHGYAYTAPTPTQLDGNAGIVAKEIVQSTDNRVFLIESVPYSTIAAGLQTLPPCITAGGHARIFRKLNRKSVLASISSLAPKGQAAAPSRPGPKRLASASDKTRKVVIDYIATIGGTLNSTTVFQSSTNWFVSSAVTCNGQVTIEGGTVFKYQTNASIRVNNTLICKGSMYRPIYFTGVDDDTVGDTLNGWPGSYYTGNIKTTGYASPAIYMGQSSLTLSNCFFRYAQQAIRYVNLGGNATLNLTHSQLVKCIRGIELDTSGCGSGSGCSSLLVNLNNVLMSGVQNPVVISSFPFPITCTAFNCTVDQASQLVSGTFVNSVWFTTYNSIYANVTNAMSGVGSSGGTNNGFYSAPPIGSGPLTNTTPPFQTVGASTHYLTNTSNFHNAGTTNRILLNYPPGLISDLRLRTTYPPTVWSQLTIATNFALTPQVARDLGPSTLDLGYHFDPIDYAVGGVILTNAVASVYGGTVIGTFNSGTNSFGLGISGGQQFLCVGSPTNRNWIVRYNTAQEQSLTNWAGLPEANSLVTDWTTTEPAPVLNCRFTDFSVPSLDACHIFAYSNNLNTLPVNLQDCQFHQGKLISCFPTFNLTNDLFERVYVTLTNLDLNDPYLRNNLFWNGSLTLVLGGSTNGVIRENLFDSTSIVDSGNVYVGGYNGYIKGLSTLSMTNSTDVFLTNSPAYQAGPLGNYYLPTNSPLIDAGSQPADFSGLYFYCTTTNQVLETNSIVDIGYHYAVPSAGFSDTLDSDGDGLPDWWEIQYGYDPNNPDTGSTGTPDGYKFDNAGDGWTLLQDYQNGSNPNVFHTPPAPAGLVARYSSGAATLSWGPCPGNVQSYIVERDVYVPGVGNTSTFFTNSPSSTTHQDNPYPAVEPDPLYQTPTYEVTAVYTGGNSPTSQVNLFTPVAVPVAGFVRGPSGNIYLAWQGANTNLPTLLLVKESMNGTTPIFTNWTLQTTSFTNGLYLLPSWMPSLIPGAQYWYIQSTNLSDGSQRLTYVDYQDVSTVAYFDGREQMKENLAFLFRAPTTSAPFSFTWDQLGYWMDYFAYQSTYAYSGFYNLGSVTGSGIPFGAYELGPFTFNELYRNFVFVSPSDVSSQGHPNTGVSFNPTLLYFPSSYYTGTVTGAVSPLLTTNLSQWILPSSDYTTFGIGTNSSGNFVLTNNTLNAYGLPYIQADLVWSNGNGDSIVLTPSGSIPDVAPYSTGTFYAQAAQPQLITKSYYFTQVPTGFPGSPALSPVPGQSSFTTSMASPPLIVSVGDPTFKIAGYAQQVLVNGYSNVFGYLGQYFDKAYKANPDGSASTNQTGVLSEYGDFLATDPGAAVVYTKPDLSQTNNLQGQCTVYALKLQLDVNHDGNMDTTFGGPDNTAPDAPFSFWINNDFDRLSWDRDDKTNYEDSVYGPSTVSFFQRLWKTPVPDCQYLANGVRSIPTVRDLEDYARLWILGVTTNLLSSLPSGCQVTLNWGDLGNPNTNNPTIDVFQAADAGGGIGYLTNSTTAGLQTNTVYVGRLGPGQSILLNTNRFPGNWVGNYLIWCGVSNGAGPLTLTISQGGTNTLSQTASYVRLQDIKQMYERWTVGDVFSLPPTNTAYLAQNDLTTPYQFLPPVLTNVPYILFVHGWNVDTWDKDRFAERAFKRLYWQGYQGRFGCFRWPTGSGFLGIIPQLVWDPNQKDNFDRSEYQAWQSANGLLNKLQSLNSVYPGRVYLLGHSMGNVVSSEAIRLSGGRVLNTYIASQAAISAHTYDGSVPNYSFVYSPWSTSPKVPNIYSNWFAANSGGGAGSVISFYNTNDYALQRSAWQLNQLFKPDQAVWANSYSWNYAYNGSTNDPPPWNNFNKYYYYSGSSKITVSLDIVNSIVNRYEAMAFAAESWTTALGATPSVGHLADVDLSTVWPADPTGQNYSEHFWHSAEFRGDFWQQQAYWAELLGPAGFRLK